MSDPGEAGAAAPASAGEVLRLTHIGGPTVLIELGGWRLLTDPTFDPPGGRYTFGWGSASRKLTGPAVAAEDLGSIDAVLLSHDHHADNLDAAGRRLLPSAGRVLTTMAGARRLGGRSIGLRPGQSASLSAIDRPSLVVTATPGRHGPRLSRPITGEVVGFAIADDGHAGTTVWVTGDTVLTEAVRATAARLRPDILVFHAGAVRFGVTGPFRYTMDAREALELVALAAPRVAIPIHTEGWGHFTEGEDVLGRAVGSSPIALRDRVRRLPIGVPVDLRPQGPG
jgi:L-ascorbate metabolism protein UlaG (beta-lactamase superfamily)